MTRSKKICRDCRKQLVKSRIETSPGFHQTRYIHSTRAEALACETIRRNAGIERKPVGSTDNSA